jgi:hypothetical protein
MCSEGNNLARGQISESVSPVRYKRCREDVCMLEKWAPGAGVPCYAFGPSEARVKNERMFKTSLLFLELEVMIIIEAFFFFVFQFIFWFVAEQSSGCCSS